MNITSFRQPVSPQDSRKPKRTHKHVFVSTCYNKFIMADEKPDLSSEFHQTMRDAAAKGLKYEHTVEKRSQALIEEGERAMARIKLSKRPSLTLNNLIASITSRFKRRKP